ncbi:MAG: glutamine--tRNA ligase/YqeY domain fusion protein [Chloroflexi bacterium]|jgi:glutaminyl-tRNA synthetase|nr:glutamine--tRNA ligase/YqeY domain fusion protein [Chloroflexota bacterium]MBT3668791.1 glutamine--tRNA ligase/YqeY domain fusion protein [Chloroflexota bacterium]MBT4002897.1 glutamine--tRNA ligase/YqeY domain fusion protein [Chloroflexota bacterium]MBT4306788.1 glutamine--tRNA ligase/YqeY domain fusion protein [Chloroflexota bacterium]MBT4534602.1 glutamine--tRNA ligase/YqeY domain fusion protein [Chloroflexota bacterium]
MTEEPKSSNFVRNIIDEHNESGRFENRVHTRFPPEPNGYLHIGHAKSICLNFGIAQDYDGKCNLRFDDTNPLKENLEYVDAIKEDVRWLGFEWENELYASDYFDTLYEWAVQLIKQGKAYVDDLSAVEMREYRGSLIESGKNSPFRDRTIEENLDLFERMKIGEFEDGARVLRAKGDMSSGNINLRDSVMYRILHATHHRTGDKWCIYPTYDWAHGQSDSIEGITHSICTLEFEDHRPLYNWYLDNLEEHHPQQIEFARLNLTNTVMSKRKLRQLVEEGAVEGWDDPRMPTLSGYRRRGVRPEAIRKFADRIGVAKANSTIDIQMLQHVIREDLDAIVPRAMAVMRPIKVVIENFPEDKVEEFEIDYYRHDKEKEEKRKVYLTREVYIEEKDFEEDPPPKYFRLTPGREVRLMGACLITATEVIKDNDGNIQEVRCTYDPESLGGQAPDGRKVKGTIHWVSASKAVDAEVRIFDHLIIDDDSYSEDEGKDFLSKINPKSKEVLQAKVESALAGASPGDRFQFMRDGYYFIDPKDSSEDHLVFNQIVGLRDTWGKQQKKK